MSKHKELSFNALRAEFPRASPAALYDVACLRLETGFSWATSASTACAGWMDMYANAPTSAAIH